MTTDPKDAEIARYDLDLMESRMVKDQWGGEWVQYSDHAAEIARLRAERDAALVRVAVLTEARHKAEADRELWREAKEKADVDVERAKAERDAALAQVTRLHHLITEASDPDFIWGAMDNVNDMDADITEFANAASRAIRASIPEPDTISRRDAQMRAEGRKDGLQGALVTHAYGSVSYSPATCAKITATKKDSDHE